jgi:hypothetical protein
VGFVAATIFVEVNASAAKLGRPGTSTKGATTSQTQVNLISDPSVDDGDVTSQGVFTYYYDPSLFSISSVSGSPGYAISGAASGIGVGVTVQTTTGYEYFGGDNAATVETPVVGAQLGYVQVGFQLDSEDGTPGPVQTQNDGDESGDVTFIITLDDTATEMSMQATNPSDMATFTSTPTGGDPNSTAPGNFPDSPDNFTVVDSNGNFVETITETPGGNEISGSSGSFQITAQTPEPSCMALLGVSGTLLLRRTRRVI